MPDLRKDPVSPERKRKRCSALWLGVSTHYLGQSFSCQMSQVRSKARKEGGNSIRFDNELWDVSSISTAGGLVGIVKPPLFEIRLKNLSVGESRISIRYGNQVVKNDVGSVDPESYQIWLKSHMGLLFYLAISRYG